MSKRFVNSALFGPLCLVFLISLIGQFSVPAHAQAQPQGSSVPAPKRVLLLYTYGDGLPAYQKATPSFLSVITAGGINTNDLFFEYLDLQRNGSAEYRKRLADLLRYKYAKHQIGLIVTVHTDALNFLLDEAKGLFPDAPIFSYLVVRPELIEAKNTGRRILQRPQNLDMGGTLEIALRMFSQARKIVFVTGANGVPMLDEEGNLKGYRGVDKDITEHKRVGAEIARARAELLRVERSSRLSELTASLAHELNQPLAAILSNAQAALTFLKSDKPDLNEFQEIMRDIISDDQRAGNVIRSLRSMMKREEGEKRPTILNDVLNDVIQIFRSEAIFRNVRIETELDGSLPPVLGDKGQLQQVVLNIIMNGSEAMSGTAPEQRKLILRTQVKDDRVRVTIRDFGPGIDPENVDRIFQPFFTTKRTGLGMGLAVCRTIVEVHGGHIWAENNPDGGTTFFIELPICESGNERVTSKE